MLYKREEWKQYSERLKSWNYTEEEIEDIREVRENLDNCPDDQFKELVAQGVVVRTRKLKKKRNYYVNEEGQFLYLDSYKRKYLIAGYFKTEDDNGSKQV